MDRSNYLEKLLAGVSSCSNTTSFNIPYMMLPHSWSYLSLAPALSVLDYTPALSVFEYTLSPLFVVQVGRQL